MLTLIRLLAWCATGTLILSAALRVGATQLWREVRARPKLYASILFVMWVLVPLLAIATTRVLAVPAKGTAVLVLVAICPGAPLLLLSTPKVKATRDVSLMAVILAGVTATLLVPLWARLLSMLYPGDLDFHPLQVIEALLPTVFAPLVVGLAIHRLSPRAGAVLARGFDVLRLVGLAVLAVLVLYKGAPVLLEVRLSTFAAALIITLGSALMGWVAGRPRVEDQKATSLAAAMGNPALAMAVVAASYPDLKPTAVIAAYVLVRIVILIPVKRWLKSRTPQPTSTDLAQPAHQT